MTPTLNFAAAGSALFLIALLLLTRPWWLGVSTRVRRRRANVAAYQTRLVELDDERRAGLLDAEAAAGLQQELGARLLADADDVTADTVHPPTARPRAWAILVVGLLLALFAGGGYWYSGSWQMQQQIARRSVSDPQVAAMVETLAEKLTQQPDNVEGWALLGRSYFVLQRFGDAAKAYAEANARAKSPDAVLLTDEGEALAFADENNLTDQSAQLFAQALELQPDLGKALWYGGLSAAQRGDAATARARWSRLSQQDLPAPMRSVLQERLLALDSVAAPANGAAAGAAPAATQAASPVTLHIRVALAPELAAKIPPNATLLVFAQADGGPPMPLAVQRIAAAQLPLEVTLDDSQAMTPAMKLSQFEHYLVSARLSQSGMAQAQSGDLQGRIKAARAEASKPLQVTIDRVVP